MAEDDHDESLLRKVLKRIQGSPMTCSNSIPTAGLMLTSTAKDAKVLSEIVGNVAPKKSLKNAGNILG